MTFLFCWFTWVDNVSRETSKMKDLKHILTASDHLVTGKKFDILKNVEINALQRINKFEVNNIINQYYSQSIFLLPLEEISNSINQLSWAKDVNLSTDFIDKLNVEIFEYKPIGLLFYNNQLFYFSD